MIQITPQMRIWVAVEPADFRRGIDGLAALCRQKLNQEPMSGAVFVFGSRRRQSIKILVYDGYRTLAIMGRAATKWSSLLRKRLWWNWLRFNGSELGNAIMLENLLSP